MAKVLVMPKYKPVDVIRGPVMMKETQVTWKAVADKRRQEAQAS